MVHLDQIQVKFGGQSKGSYFKVTEENVAKVIGAPSSEVFSSF